MEKIKKPELLAPVSDFTSLRAALDAGADAVFFGATLLSMRIKAKNFVQTDLPEIVRLCKEKDVKTYMTINAIIYNPEVSRVAKLVAVAKEAGVNAIICWDFAVIQECKKQNMPFNVSTQASISNASAAHFFEDLGAETIILSRECTLEHIKEIKKEIKKSNIEVFIHGAMCVAVSGRCFMSQQVFNRSANRGDCLHNCRREYRITDIEEPDKEFVIGQDYVMSAKDLCTLPIFEKVIESGVDILKIEGRRRSPEYVKTVVGVYRRAIDAYFEGKLNDELKDELMVELKKVYNRGLSTGFFENIPTEKQFGNPNTQATTIKKQIGIVVNFFKKASVAEIKVRSHELKIGDLLMIQGPTTGVQEQKIVSMEIEHKKVERVLKGENVAIKLDFLARVNDQVYIIEDRN